MRADCLGHLGPSRISNSNLESTVDDTLFATVKLQFLSNFTQSCNLADCPLITCTQFLMQLFLLYFKTVNCMHSVRINELKDNKQTIDSHFLKQGNNSTADSSKFFEDF